MIVNYTSAKVFQNKLEKGETLTFHDAAELAGYYSDGTASLAKLVEPCLGKLYCSVRDGGRVKFSDRFGIVGELTADNLKEFVTEFFDAQAFYESATFEFGEKIKNHQPISRQDINNLTDFCLREKAPAINAVINILHFLFNSFLRKESYCYYDKKGNVKTLLPGTFKEFVSENFCEAMYDEVIKDFEQGKYRRFE